MNIEKYEKYSAMIAEVMEEPNNMSRDWESLLAEFAALMLERAARDRDSQIMQCALHKYGAAAQTIVAFEEMSELQKELCKNYRGKDNKDAIAEEIADVQIMLEQMILLHDIRGEVNRWHKLKVQRLYDNLKEGVNDGKKSVS